MKYCMGYACILLSLAVDTLFIDSNVFNPVSLGVVSVRDASDSPLTSGP